MSVNLQTDQGPLLGDPRMVNPLRYLIDPLYKAPDANSSDWRLTLEPSQEPSDIAKLEARVTDVVKKMHTMEGIEGLHDLATIQGDHEFLYCQRKIIAETLLCVASDIDKILLRRAGILVDIQNNNRGEAFGEFVNTIKHARLVLNNLIDIFLKYAEKRKGGHIAKTVRQNLNHDALQLFYSTANAAIAIADYPDRLNSKRLSEFDIFSELALFKNFLKANAKLIEGTGELATCDVKEVLCPAVACNAERFKYSAEFREGHDESVYSRPGTITCVVSPDAKNIFVDPDLIRLIIYNLLKNPMKMAQEEDEKIAVVVNIEKSGDCIAIFVRDTGTGISYDEQRDYHTQSALTKMEQGAELTILEQLLVDEVWRDKVTPLAMNRELFKRGESHTGGTGVGLDLVKKSMDMHQGAVRIYDHPKYGTGVQLLIPDTASTDRLERTCILEKTVLEEHQRHLPVQLVA